MIANKRVLQGVLSRLRAHANPKNVAGMARFGINPKGTLGVNVLTLRQFAKEIGTDHALAQKLWRSNIHEARILASFIDDPTLVTERQMERWVRDFDSWDVCDEVCSNLFDRTALTWRKATEWPHRTEEYVRRAGFVLMAALAVHDKQVPDRAFAKFFPLIKRYATDERNFVKKAVNWALRQIGKRSATLRRHAIQTAREIQGIDSRAARWIAADALREFREKKISKSLRSRKK